MIGPLRPPGKLPRWGSHKMTSGEGNGWIGHGDLLSMGTSRVRRMKVVPHEVQTWLFAAARFVLGSVHANLLCNS
jgi:hypothetical protein